tara:strand:- start:77 stop:1144 length:1068 start_codon:yes stop_codon:yes gene_type:complete
MNNKFKFECIKKSHSSFARQGYLHTNHGIIKTPVFMPVGTQGSVKALTPEMLESSDVEIILSNTYHLALRPGGELIESFNGLHSFMNWNKPILTDSGGFQVFSLAKNRKITDNGVTFNSHLNGSPITFTPKSVIDLQRQFNSDIMMPLDICTAYPASEKQVIADLKRTHAWEEQAYHYWQSSTNNQWLFAIIQGGMYPHLRTQSVNFLTQFDFPGYAIGGVSVGESFDEMTAILTHTLSLLPDQKPRYIMGLGLPENLEFAIHHGADMFDCVLPTRLARHGQVFIGKQRINIKRAEFKLDKTPIDSKCHCYTCQNYSKAYLRHLFISGELLSHTLLSIHNIYTLIQFVKKIRNNI